MVFYVPGTEETDSKKQNMSLQQLGGGLTTATTNIATNTTNIAANTTSITALQTVLTNLAAPLTNSLGADVLLNNTANYFDGPSVAQGTAGTWFACGTVTVLDTAGARNFNCKLWDGTTVIASAVVSTAGAGFSDTLSLSGFIAAPAGNIRISCNEPAATTGKIQFNQSGNSKDSTITAIRIA